MSTKKGCSGYSLIELAIVLAILGMVGGLALNVETHRTENTNLATTKTQLDAIDKALGIYISQNKALPCPAIANRKEGAADFGVAAGNTPAQCNGAPTSGAGSLTVSYGIVPTRSLGLPDSAMYDSWGNRLNYAVIRDMTLATGPSSYANYRSTATNARAIKIVDASGNPVVPNDAAFNVRYVVYSSGPDKKGAYSRASDDTVPAKASPQIACGAALDSTNCLNTGTFRDMTIRESTGAANYYYDLMRWQTFETNSSQWMAGGCVADPTTSQYIAVSTDATPFIYLYKFDGCGLTLLPAPAVLPDGPAYNINFTSDNSEIIFATAIPGQTWNGSIFDYHVTPTGLTPNYNSGYCCQNQGFSALSPDNNYFAAPRSDMKVLQKSAGQYTSYMTAPNTTGGYHPVVTFSPDSQKMYYIASAKSYGNNDLYEFTRSGTSWNITRRINFCDSDGNCDDSPPGAERNWWNMEWGYFFGMAIHPSGNFLAIDATDVQGPLIVRTPLSSPFVSSVVATITDNSYGGDLAWSPDGTLIAETSYGNKPTLIVTHFDTATYAWYALTQSGANCGNQGVPSWSKDGKFVASGDVNKFCIFSVSGNTYTNMNISTTNPSGTVWGVAFSR